jgi:hypothetical protein
MDLMTMDGSGVCDPLSGDVLQPCGCGGVGCHRGRIPTHTANAEISARVQAAIRRLVIVDSRTFVFTMMAGNLWGNASAGRAIFGNVAKLCNWDCGDSVNTSSSSSKLRQAARQPNFGILGFLANVHFRLANQLYGIFGLECVN